jgi:sporulation protein YlmC with PRC-barrel domain
MKALMTATSLAALIAASSAFAQSQDPMPQDPLVDNPPAAMEPATPDTGVMPAPGGAQDLPYDSMSNDTMSPDNPAMSETDPSEATPTTPATEQAASPDIFIPQQEADDILASSLIGTSVENPAGEALGDINDVVLSDAGSVDAIIIGVGGFLGIGEKNVGVNFDAIEETADADGNIVLVLNATAEQLESAPQYVTVASLRQEDIQEPVTPAPTAPAVPTQ